MGKPQTATPAHVEFQADVAVAMTRCRYSDRSGKLHTAAPLDVVRDCLPADMADLVAHNCVEMLTAEQIAAISVVRTIGRERLLRILAVTA